MIARSWQHAHTARLDAVQATTGLLTYAGGNNSDTIVTIGPNTKVTADNNPTLTGLTYQSVGVGQHVIARGVCTAFCTSPGTGAITLDATNASGTSGGSVRLIPTSLWGTLVSSAAGSLVFNLQTVSDWPVTDFRVRGQRQQCRGGSGGRGFRGQYGRPRGPGHHGGRPALDRRARDRVRQRAARLHRQRGQQRTQRADGGCGRGRRHLRSGDAHLHPGELGSALDQSGNVGRHFRRWLPRVRRWIWRTPAWRPRWSASAPKASIWWRWAPRRWSPRAVGTALRPTAGLPSVLHCRCSAFGYPTVVAPGGISVRVQHPRRPSPGRDHRGATRRATPTAGNLLREAHGYLRPCPNNTFTASSSVNVLN